MQFQLKPGGLACIWEALGSNRSHYRLSLLPEPLQLNDGFFDQGRTMWRCWLRHCVTGQKVPGSIPDGVTGIFPSGCSMAVWLTLLLIYMSARNIFWGGTGGHFATFMCGLSLKSQSLNLVQSVQSHTQIALHIIRCIDKILIGSTSHNKSLLTFICVQVLRLSQRCG